MVMDCAHGECLVSLNGRIMTELDEIHGVSEGSTVRIWYTVFPRQDDPADLVPGIEQTCPPSGGTRSTADAHAPSASYASQSEAPQYVPGTFLQNLVAFVLCSRCFSNSWHGRKVHRSTRNKMQGSRSRVSTTMAKRTPRRSWRHALLLFAGLWTGGSQADRFGEAQHPGPDAWIGTINPSGVSGKESILARVPYGVL